MSHIFILMKGKPWKKVIRRPGISESGTCDWGGEEGEEGRSEGKVEREKLEKERDKSQRV